MNERRAIKEFTVEEWTLPGGFYKIEVRDAAGTVVDTFVWPTMRAAIQSFENAGYKRGSWPDSPPRGSAEVEGRWVTRTCRPPLRT